LPPRHDGSILDRSFLAELDAWLAQLPFRQTLDSKISKLQNELTLLSETSFTATTARECSPLTSARSGPATRHLH